MIDDFVARRLKADPDLAQTYARGQKKREITQMLRRMRKSAGLTQSQLAMRANWKQPFVSRMERFDSAVPDEATIAKFAAACGMVKAEVTYSNPETGQTAGYQYNTL